MQIAYTKRSQLRWKGLSRTDDLFLNYNSWYWCDRRQNIISWNVCGEQASLNIKPTENNSNIKGEIINVLKARLKESA